MGSLKRWAGAAAMLAMTGCLEDKGIVTDGTSSPTAQPDSGFTVSAAPPASTGDSPPQTLPVDNVDVTSGKVIDINRGDKYTMANLLNVAINYDGDAIAMRISHNTTCLGGTWEALNDGALDLTRSVSLADSELNAVVSLSVAFLDADQHQTKCFYTSIIQDNAAPEILFQRYPLANLEVGSTTQIAYDVRDAGIGVTSVQCTLNGNSKPCLSGSAVIDIPAMAQGSYTFEVVATDGFGFIRRKSISWAVTSSSRHLTQAIHVDEYRKWDILFIIDNSGSMEYEQKSMAQRTQNFLSVLKGLDWQIAIATTDPTDKVLGDGRFVPMKGLSGVYRINSTMDSAQAQKVLSDTLQRSETGSGVEQAIRATYRVVERSKEPGNPEHQAFFRDGAQFAAIVISDEDESDNKLRNDPESLVSFIHTTFNSQRNFVFNSIIFIPGDKNCTEGATEGRRYQQLSQMTDGVIGSSCATDYAAQVSGVADRIRNMVSNVTLQCIPVAGSKIMVRKNSADSGLAFTVTGVQMKFAQPLAAGDYQISYDCPAQ